MQFFKQLLDVPLSQKACRDLSSIVRVLEFLDNPHQAYPSIHVAGSNGKGSVCWKIAKAWELSGYRVGLFTSPHLMSFCERIQINSQLITEDWADRGLESIFKICDELRVQLTFFELVTVLAFDYFRQKQVDIVILETGLGGRWDATNVVIPILSIITSISLEHCAILGADREGISQEKAGIFKDGVPVVLGPKAVTNSICARAQELACPIYLVEPPHDPFYDHENRAIAAQALDLFPFLQHKAITHALEERPPCRFEERDGVLIDVAHNPDAFARLVEGLELKYPNQKKRFFFGICQDKDWKRCLALIRPIAEHIYLIQAPSARATSLENLACALSEMGYPSYSSHPCIQTGFERARSHAVQRGELLVVCGSFYLISSLSPAKISATSA